MVGVPSAWDAPFVGREERVRGGVENYSKVLRFEGVSSVANGVDRPTLGGMPPGASTTVSAAKEMLAWGPWGVPVAGAATIFGFAASALYASTIALARSISPKVLAFCNSSRRCCGISDREFRAASTHGESHPNNTN